MAGVPLGERHLRVPQAPYAINTLDPRSASTQSLAPSRLHDDDDPRRRLLIVYIHGFLGNDESFSSFPWHVHNLLKSTVAATHVVHSKIYPRYKTYRAFHLATDGLSKWLAANEDPRTDVILVGHSMGGLLAADLALMDDRKSGSKTSRKHRILGTVNLDVPFLGAQNRVILAGILSPFRSKSGPMQMPQPGVSGNHSSMTLHSSATTSVYSFDVDHTSDPSFNAPFPNDVRTTTRPWKQSLMHFAQKHKDDGLFHASFRHWKAHFEFGSCLLDARRLKMRYERLRGLDPSYSGTTAKSPPSTTAPRVNFVQFYTACYKGRAGQELADSMQSSPLESREPSLCGSTVIPVAGNPSQVSPVPLPAEQNQLFFCKLAHQDGGQVDSQWVKVMMMTNDEIVAHTILFKPGPHYEQLVEQVSAEMTKWVTEAFPCAGDAPAI